MVFKDFRSVKQKMPDGSWSNSHYQNSHYNAPEIYEYNSKRNLKLCDNWSIGLTFCEKILGCDNLYKEFMKYEYNYEDEDLCNMNNSDLIKESGILKTGHFAWTNFIKEKLNEAGVGSLMKEALVDLLNPDRTNTRSVSEILENLKEKSKDNKEEYDELCKKLLDRGVKRKSIMGVLNENIIAKEDIKGNPGTNIPKISRDITGTSTESKDITKV
jgi:hypothetical protein